MINRFKALDLVDRVPEGLWKEVCSIVQEAVTKDILKKKKCKKAKWLSEEALQITEERREVKNKGERERYTYVNAKFQRIARRSKKSFYNEQCKEAEGNNRMGKARDLFKKVRAIKGTFHARMGKIKDIKCKNLTEAEEIKKMWEEYIEELYKKGLNDPDNHDYLGPHLEKDVLEYEVKWASGSITTKGFPSSSAGKESTCNAEDPGLIPVRKIPWRKDRLPTPVFLGFPGGSAGKDLPAMQETCVQSLGWGDPLEKGKATHSSSLAWKIPWAL